MLTFDDGPHAKHTDEILEILQHDGAPALFFKLGQNLGRVDAQGKPPAMRCCAMTSEVNDSGRSR